jgi:hypothetical protein
LGEKEKRRIPDLSAFLLQLKFSSGLGDNLLVVGYVLFVFTPLGFIQIKNNRRCDKN